MTKSISIDTIKKFSVLSQCIDGVNSDQTIEDVIKKIGLIQLDSVSTILRSHYLVMYSRIGNYDREVFDELYLPLNITSEQWIHVASLILTEDLTRFAPLVFERRKQPINYKKLKLNDVQFQKMKKRILKAIEKNGPLPASHFIPSEMKHTKDWWGKKTERRVLDYLFRRGYLEVAFRKSFRQHFKLRENNYTHSSEKLIEFYEWAIIKSIEAIGVASFKHIQDYFRLDRSKTLFALESLISRARIVKIEVEGIDEKYFSLPENNSILTNIENGSIEFTKTVFLSPFDNLIWERSRTLDIFNFSYKSEMYVPKDKRLFGYYVMPILHKGDLIGRIDPTFDSTTKVLLIRNVFFEKGLVLTNDIYDCVVMALKEFGLFLKAEDIIVEKPNIIKSKLHENSFKK